MPVCKLNFAFLEFSKISLVSSFDSFSIFLSCLFRHNGLLQIFFCYASDVRWGKRFRGSHAAGTKILENLEDLK